MGWIPKRLAVAAPGSTAETTIYTTPTLTKTIIKQIVIANVAAVSATVDVSLVPSGAAVADGNRLLKGAVVQSHTMVVLDLTQVLEAGDFISVRSGVANALTFVVSGVSSSGAAVLPAVGLAVAKAGFLVGVAPRINFIEGANVVLAVTDDLVNGEVDVVIASTGGGGGGSGGHVVKKAGIPFTARTGLNFSDGPYISITVADDPGNNETDITITATGAPAHTHLIGDMPPEVATDAEVATAMAVHEGAVDPHAGYQKESEKGVAGGYAGLDGSGLILDAAIPAGIARDTEITAAVNALVAAAPGALDTLDELAAALADDPNFATTMTTALAGKQATSAKGQPNGYAGLDGSGLLIDAIIPAAIARDTEVTAAITAHEALADPHLGYQKESEKGAASGYAALDAGTKVPTAQLGGAGADATKYLRGDQTWQVVAGGGGETDALVFMGGF